jgi:hypothetical protein
MLVLLYLASLAREREGKFGCVKRNADRNLSPVGVGDLQLNVDRRSLDDPAEFPDIPGFASVRLGSAAII